MRRQRAIGVLEREVEVRDGRRRVEHRLHERVVHLARVEVQQPHAGEPLGRGSLSRRRSSGASEPGSPASRRTRRGPGRRARLGDAARHEVARLGDERIGLRASAACRGTTGSRRTRMPGRSPRRPSDRPMAPPAGSRQLQEVPDPGRLPAGCTDRHLGSHQPADRALSGEPDDGVDLGELSGGSSP